MKRNAMRRNLRNSILRSLGRYIAIAAIIALGAGIFVGLLMTKSDMLATGQQYMDQQNMFDIRLVSTYGWAEEQLEKARTLEGIESAEGVFYTDLVATFGDNPEEQVYRFYSIPDRLNEIVLLGGRMPEHMGECLLDGYHKDDSVLGKKILVSASSNEEEDLEALKLFQYTVVGYISSPLYMDMNRGTTSVGSGSLSGYVFLPQESVSADYYSEIHLKLPGNHTVYSDVYNDFLEDTVDAIEPYAEQLGQERFDAVKAEAEEEYQDGYQEYLDGVEEYEEGKLEAEQELADALQELKDGEQEIKDNQWKLENAERDLYNGKITVKENIVSVNTQRNELAAQKAQLESIKSMQAGRRAELEAQYGSLSSILAAPGELKSVNEKISQVQEELNHTDSSDSETIAALQEKLSGLVAQKGKLEEKAANAGEAAEIQGVLTGLDQVYAGEQKLNAAHKQLKEALEEIEINITKVYNGYEDLEEARQDLAEGWEDYYEGKAEAEEELADAAQELEDARIDLAEAREDIDSMEKPDIMVLDRNSNVGYNNLSSSADIVQGVARVIPVFFLLIASLVCITTMTRMIEEERTQIGTLKALGYSSAAIVSKYLFYAGSSAILGCSLGILAGCSVFPMTIWEAYKMMLHIPLDMVLTVNWTLSILVVTVYLMVILAVTWYCCHRTLEEVPAELIRPKAPDTGKALLVERLPFWSRISFLNKVTIRNIFRYRQRLAMMLVGIGGCTALLVTGFGLRDSIVNVVDYQFEKVTHYDLEVYFRDDLDTKDKEEFLKELGPEMNSMFYHQSSFDLDFNNRIKEIYLIAAGEELTSFIHFQRGKDAVSMPQVNEVVLSVGVAEAMGIHVGDALTMRNSDMETLSLTVSGIYDNHVDNYAVIIPETIQAQWGKLPAQEMAFVSLPDGADVYSMGASLTELNTVMNVSVSADRADMVKNMMDALDMVIVLVVFCAGLLAVTVLYNLTNININERIREIATIKVLGFNASETASYVFKENMTLTVAGSVLGLALGYLLLVFVIAQVKIDTVWFKPLVMPVSYVYSLVLTWLSAIAVNFIFYFKLQKINMAEALKSVE